MRFLNSFDEDMRPPLAPLIDVVFLLIIFFMVSTVFIDFQKELRVQLPESRAYDEEKKETTIIAIDRTQQIYFNEVKVSLLELEDILHGRPDIKSVVIRADKKLHYEYVIRVIGLCRDIGITEVGVAVLPETNN